MSGKPGRSGGARPNSGPKRKPPAQVLPAVDEKAAESAPAGELEPLEFLRQVMLGVIDPSPSQLKAAIAAAQYCHAKVGEGGKKEQAAGKAKQASKGKFASSAPPRLVYSNK